MSELIHIFDPESAPIRGMQSGINAASLPKGFFSQITNFRFNALELKVRQGLQKLTTAGPLAGASLRGAFSGKLQGSSVLIAAYRVGAVTLVYSINPTTYTFTEITHDGSVDARNGNTRFSADAWISYAVISDQNGLEVLVMQNGTDQPRVYDPSAPVHEQVASHLPVNPPNLTTQEYVSLGFSNSVDLYENGSRTSIAYGSSNFTSISAVALSAGIATITTTASHGLTTGQYCTISGALGVNINGIWLVTDIDATHFSIPAPNFSGTWTGAGMVSGRVGFGDHGYGSELTTGLNISENAVQGDYAVLSFGSLGTPLNLTASRQLVIILSGSDSALWYNLKLEAGNGATWATVWDPSSTLSNPVYVPGIDPNNPNTYAIGFSTDALDPTNIAINSCKELRFTWVGASPPIGGDIFDILMIATSGTVEGSAFYGITWMNSQSRAESFGLEMTAPTTTYIQANGGAPNDGLRIPNSPLLYYVPTVYYQNVTAAEINFGTDTLCVYRQDYGDLGFTLAAQIPVNTFVANAWVTTNANHILSWVDTVSATNKNLSRVMPDGYHKPIPIGSSMLSTGGRLYVGGVTSNKNQVWISEAQRAWKFRSQVRFLDAYNADPTSPTIDTFPGETVTAIARTGGRLVGVNPVYVFTIGHAYRLDGANVRGLSTPTVISRTGTNYPRTVTEHAGRLYWLDNELQVQVLEGASPKPISKLKVDDKLASGTMTLASAAIANNRYYLSYAAQGTGANHNVLIFEEELNEWCEDSYPSQVLQQLVTFDDPLYRKVLAFSDLGNIYQVEAAGQSTDDGTAIPAALSTGRIHDGMWNRIYGGRFGVVSDVTASTLAVSRSWQPVASGQDGTVNLSLGTGVSWLWEHAANDVKPGGQGVSVQLNLSASLPAAFQIYAMVMRMDASRDSGANSGG